MVRLFLIFFSLRLFADVSALYLAWVHDPTTTMTIQWHTPDSEPGNAIYLQTVDGDWSPIEGSHKRIEDLLVHSLSLKRLDPDTEYHFRIGNHPEVYAFRTAPAYLDNPLRFIVGGDVYHTKKVFRRMNQTIVEQDPLFCVIGGDIAYAIHSNPFNLRSTGLSRWLSFLSEWKEQMISPDGRLIPFVLVAGNHDIATDNYELFFTLFDFPERQLYRTLDFGDYLSLILLDTNHFQPIEGRQTLWLKNVLSERLDMPYRFVIYHKSAYPSHYPYKEPISQKIRTYWCPLFDQYNISAAFENHNHTFKKTFPLKGGKIDSDGILYLGDGCWGAVPRKTNDMWYLDKRARKSNVYLIELTPTQAHLKAIDLVGDPIDSTFLNPLISSEK